MLGDLAKRLKSMREAEGLSQAKIASMIETTQASVNRYENGLTSPPLHVLLWYAEFFDVSMDYIFCRTEHPQGKLYKNNPKVIEAISKENKEIRRFVEMCFDASSPVSKKLKETLAKMLEENKK